MFIKFKKYKTIENVHLTNGSILKLVNDLLTQRKSNTISIFKNQILFENTSWKFGSNLASMSQVDKGSITLNRDIENINLMYKFQIRILTDLLLIATFLIAGFVFDYLLILVSIAILVQLLIRVIRTRNKGHFFLNEIEEVLKQKNSTTPESEKSE